MIYVSTKNPISTKEEQKEMLQSCITDWTWNVADTAKHFEF